jgi:hypothetical protein
MADEGYSDSVIDATASDSAKLEVAELLIVGDWEGQGEEVYCEVDKTKIYKLGFKIETNLKKVNEHTYRIKTKYYFSKTGKIFGLEYKKGKLAGSDNNLVTKTKYGFISSSLWNEKDPLSRTVEKFTLDKDLNMSYVYNTNNIVNPLNSYFKKLSNSAGRLVGMQTGKISVSGSFMLTKVKDE